MGPAYYKDITALTIGGTTIEAVLDIDTNVDPVKLRSTNNGVVDGAVALNTIDRVLTLTVNSQDYAMNSLPVDDAYITISFNAVPMTNTIYTAAVARTFIYTRMVPMTDSFKNLQKDHAVFTRSYQMLSGGTLTETNT